MERSVDVATGESVAFSYELAGLGSRFLAILVDLSIQIGVLILALVLIAWAGMSLPEPKHAAAASKVADAIVTAIAVIAVFVLFFGYFIVFEWRFNGRTPGKRLLGIRVVRDGGFPMDFTASVVRNVVRVLEFGFGFYTISAIATLLSPRNRRLGDMAAGTIVVRDNRYERTASRSFGADGAERDDPLVRDLSPSQRELILRYVERRETLDLGARTAVAASIAAGVRPKLGASFEHIDDDHLLVHLATTALS
jgi:uncharacterized RDD family membrane protein YckC